LSPPRPRWGSGQASDGVWLGLALVVGALLRFWDLPSASLYSDEAFTFDVARLPLPALLQTLARHDFHPPLFYLSAHVLMLALRWPLTHYRFFTALCGLVTIAATWAFARGCAGALAAAIAALCVALAPALVQYDRLFRMHAVAVALSALSWWLLVQALGEARRRRWPWWLAYGLAVALLCYTDYLGLIVLGLQCAFALFALRRRWPVLAAGAGTALLYVPWLWALRAQFPLGGLATSRPALDASLLAAIRAAFVADVPDAWLHLPAFDTLVALGVLVVGLSGAWFGRKTPLPFWLAMLPAQILLSVVLAKNLAYFPRYLLIALPAFAVAFGWSVAALWTPQRRIVASAVAGIAIVVLAFGTSQLLFDPYYQFPDWYAVDALVLQHARPGDAIVLDAAYEFEVVRNYQGFRKHRLLKFMNPSDFGAIEGWISAHPQQRIWYVEHQNFYWDPQRRIETSLAERRPQVLTWREPRQAPVDAVRVSLYDRIPMTKK